MLEYLIYIPRYSTYPALEVDVDVTFRCCDINVEGSHSPTLPSSTPDSPTVHQTCSFDGAITINLFNTSLLSFSQAFFLLHTTSYYPDLHLHKPGFAIHLTNTSNHCTDKLDYLGTYRISRLNSEIHTPAPSLDTSFDFDITYQHIILTFLPSCLVYHILRRLVPALIPSQNYNQLSERFLMASLA